MFSKIAIGVAAVGLTLAAAAVQPASANYAPCTENPTAKGCPMYITPIKPQGSVKACSEARNACPRLSGD
jgi:hypothetical protein